MNPIIEYIRKNERPMCVNCEHCHMSKTYWSCDYTEGDLDSIWKSCDKYEKVKE